MRLAQGRPFSLLEPILVCIVATGLSACGATTYQQISTSPEAQLYYPGSHVVSKNGAGEDSGIDIGHSPAWVQVVLTSDAPIEKIYAWYRSHLLGEGWQLRKVETANGSYYGFTKGDKQVFYVALQPSTGTDTTYSIKYGLLPQACATTPPPLSLANC